MSKNTLETIKKLQKLAAWHRIKAEDAGADGYGRRGWEPPRISSAEWPRYARN